MIMIARALGKEAELPQAEPIRVAIADDSTVARAMMGWALEKAGMKVVATASNGRDAISTLASADVDVLVLDIDRKRVVWGKCGSVRVDIGGGRIIEKKTK